MLGVRARRACYSILYFKCSTMLHSVSFIWSFVRYWLVNESFKMEATRSRYRKQIDNRSFTKYKQNTAPILLYVWTGIYLSLNLLVNTLTQKLMLLIRAGGECLKDNIDMPPPIPHLIATEHLFLYMEDACNVVRPILLDIWEFGTNQICTICTSRKTKLNWKNVYIHLWTFLLHIPVCANTPIILYKCLPVSTSSQVPTLRYMYFRGYMQCLWVVHTLSSFMAFNKCSTCMIIALGVLCCNLFE